MAPLAVVLNAVMGRYLGPSILGYYYLAGSFVAFGFLAVEWGQAGTLPALVAKNRARAGEYLGSGLAFRLVASVVVCAALLGAAALLKYDMEFRVVLALMLPAAIAASMITGCYDTIRGFERTDVAAYSQVGGQLLTICVVLPTLLLGGDVRAVLVANLVGTVALLGVVWRTLRPAGIGALTVSRGALRNLVVDGLPFMWFNVAIALYGTVDAVLLSKLAPSDVVGWHAAALKLVGILVFPAAALVTALYPTLVRLFNEDLDAYLRTARSALRGTLVLAAPLALGCVFYPDIGIRIFSRESFGPAEDNLRVTAVFLALTYVSMPLGTCLLAAGRHRIWAIVQFVSVGIRALSDFVMIPWFQAKVGNGGLGVCWAMAACEATMVAAAVFLAPRGIFDGSFVRHIALTVVGGGAMAGTAYAMSSLNSFIAAPVALIVYGATMWVTGGVDRGQVRTVLGMVAGKLRRR